MIKPFFARRIEPRQQRRPLRLCSCLIRPVRTTDRLHDKKCQSIFMYFVAFSLRKYLSVGKNDPQEKNSKIKYHPGERIFLSGFTLDVGTNPKNMDKLLE
ncbi:hypothetical protein NPIL_177451 [Nephila pilipes]|uniref:Uncharacterized protein n=1 Tax=Nephila pilipes TaxID=299642 RepID=A0A8X6R7X7_NEPPI|nr:hypothetical protein NPIL_177451 [Nephila pilipes]